MVVGLRNPKDPPSPRVRCDNVREASGAVPIIFRMALKSSSPVLHYAEGTGKISAPLAEEGHDRQSPWAWALRLGMEQGHWSRAGTPDCVSVTTLG